MSVSNEPSDRPVLYEVELTVRLTAPDNDIPQTGEALDNPDGPLFLQTLAALVAANVSNRLPHIQFRDGVAFLAVESVWSFKARSV